MHFSKLFLRIACIFVLPLQATAQNHPLSQPPAKAQGVLFNQLAEQCGSAVHPDTLQAVARVESQFNPYVIGVVKGHLKRQPRNLNEAVAAAKMLHAQGRNFSMGLMQINRYNLPAYGLNYETVFHPCKNIQAGAAILADCFKRAGGVSQTHLQQALSCYYSGNFRTGFYADFKGQPPYVVKILNAARVNRPNQLLAHAVPAINPTAALAAPVKAATSRKTTGKPVGGQTIQAGTVSTDKDKKPFTVHVLPRADEQANASPQPERKREAWDVFGDF